jgi:hypothetical protein
MAFQASEFDDREDILVEADLRRGPSRPGRNQDQRGQAEAQDPRADSVGIGHGNLHR